MATTPKKRGPIYSNMGRPRSTEVLATFAPWLKDHIIKLRNNHPGWGPKTIYEQLKIDSKFKGSVLPSVRSIATLLKAKGLVKSYDKYIPIPQSNRQKAQRPHHIWELDAQGAYRLKGLGPITMINIKDSFSRIYCMAYPNPKKSIYGFSKRSDYQCALRLAFMENGLPEILQTDHEGIFHENKGGSAFPTLFHLWLIGLGISKIFSRIRRPTDQARVERMHQTIERQAIQGIEHQDWQALFSYCQQRRKFLNQVLPCSSLNHQAPYEAFADHKHSGRYYQPHLEEQMMDLKRIYTFLQGGKWFRRTSKAKTLTLGGQVYYLAKAQPQTEILIRFDAKTLMLSFYDVKEHLLQKLPIKGITKRILIGDVFWKMSNVQLELPLCWETQKVSMTFLHNA